MIDSQKTKRLLLQEIEDLRQRLTALESGNLQLFNRAIEASANGIVIADAQAPDMPLIYINPAFESISGFSASDCLGKNCRFLHQDDREQEGLDHVRRAIAKRQDCHVVIRNYRKNGSLFWNELYLSPVFNSAGLLTHYIGVQNDITKRVQLQESKDMFLQIASHDLKSPLSAVLTAADILCRIAPPGTSVTEEVHHVFSNIVSRGREMRTIIEDYLDFMALEDGQIKLSCEDFDLGNAIDEVIKSNLAYAQHKSIHLTFDLPAAPCRVHADRHKINQVAQNLVGNAIKYGSKGDQVCVRLSAGDSQVRVDVMDNGPGLNPEDLRRVFMRYARLSNKPTAGEKSSGLGLYICKKLIDLHEGEIGVYNNPEKGATFWFELKPV